jgi:molybdopterin molybdotransferase
MSSPTEFFNVQPVQATLTKLFEQWQASARSEIIPTQGALGRTLARPPLAPSDLPAFPRSSMDGYAVSAADTFGASQSLPAYLEVVERIPMGALPQKTLGRGQAAEIFTGAMLPTGADAVVMVEQVQKINPDEVEVLAPVASGENVIQVGEDVAQGQPFLTPGQILRPQDIGGLLALGLLSVEVIIPPRVAIIGSGDELIPPDQTPALGQIRDVNSYALGGLVSGAGGQPLLLGLAKDTPESLYDLAQRAFAAADILVLTAGSSLSTRDLTRETIERLGKPGVLQHGLAVKPGKPTIVSLCAGKPVIGLPGNPVSAYLVARQLLLPILRHYLGQPTPLPARMTARLSANIASSTGREDTQPVKLVATEDGWHAEPIFGKSNLIFTLVQADGVVEVPLNSNGLKAGSMVEVALL